MEYSTYRRLNKAEVEAFLVKDDKVLFLGPGEKRGLNVLLSASREVLNVDVVDKPVSSSLDWLKGDVWDLDYDKYKKAYTTVILQRLCSKEYQASMPLQLLSRLIGFEKIIIEFCDNIDHYDLEIDGLKLEPGERSMKIVASRCEELLSNNGYNSRVVYNDRDGLFLKLFSLLNATPRIVKPELCNGFCDPGFPPGFWDGNYYD